MALTDIERVRNKIGDSLTIHREKAIANGVSDNFKLEYEPISTLPVPQIWLDDTLQVEGIDYSINYDHGIVTFANAPTTNQEIIFQYYSVIWTDAEIQDFLDQYSSNTNIAAAHILFAWAADAAKRAKRETRSGGGGLGAITVDTSVAARELRNSAQALLDYEAEYGTDIGTNVPADGLTEIPWTEAAYEQSATQRIIREN